MKEIFLNHKKLFVGILVLAILVPIIIFAGQDIGNLIIGKTPDLKEDRPPKEDPNTGPITEDKTEDPELEPEPEPVPEPEPEPDPVPEPEPVPKPEPNPEPEPDPLPVPSPEPEPVPMPEPQPQPKPDTKPDPTPTIYVGQELRIPGTSGNQPNAPSKLVKQGLLNSSAKQIALTFDAGWLYEDTIDLLNALDKHKVKSTFFLRGHWVSQHPDLAREILRRGHSVENHSLTHGHMRDMTDNQIRNEIVETTNIINNITGYKPYLFRPPYGEYNNKILEILGQEGYPYTIMWTIDTHDWAEELNGVKVTQEYVINRVLDNASDKGIVLMHIGGHHTVDALPHIISGLKNAGYNLVKVNDMLGKPTNSTGETIYTVKQGDTLWGISQKFNVTVEDIIELNELNK